MAALHSFRDVRRDLILKDWLTRHAYMIHKSKNQDKYFVQPVYRDSLLNRCLCTDREMESLVPLLQFILRLHETNQRKGLLGIYDEYSPDDIPDSFLKSTLNLVLDGYRAEKLAQTLNRHISNSRESGKPLMKKLLIADGCLSLVKGNTVQQARHHYDNFFFRYKFQVDWNLKAL